MNYSQATAYSQSIPGLSKPTPVPLETENVENIDSVEQADTNVPKSGRPFRPQSGYRPAPIPLKICAYCQESFREDTDGITSLSKGAWYCSTMCMYQARLSHGDPVPKQVVDTLIRYRKKYNTNAMIRKHTKQNKVYLSSRRFKVVQNKI